MQGYAKAMTTVLELGDLPKEVLTEVAMELLRLSQYHLCVTERDPERKAYYDGKRQAFNMLSEVVTLVVEGNTHLEDTVAKRKSNAQVVDLGDAHLRRASRKAEDDEH